MVVGPGVLKPVVFVIDLFRTDGVALGRHVGHGAGVEGLTITEFWRHLASERGVQRWVRPKVEWIRPPVRILVGRSRTSQRR